MNAHIHNALLVLSLAPLSFTMGCDQSIDDDIDSIDRQADEIDDVDNMAFVDDFTLFESDDVVLEDIVDEEGRPLTSEIFVLESSPADQRRDDVTGRGEAPSLEALGHAIGIGPRNIPAHADELVADDNPMLASLKYEGSYAFGNNLFGGSWDIIRGPSSCGSGKTRAFATAYAEGSGSCYVVGWYTFDPNDCRIRVRINRSGGFANGLCRMFAYIN